MTATIETIAPIPQGSYVAARRHGKLVSLLKDVCTTPVHPKPDIVGG
jgi:hypothetical protein